MFFYPTDYKLSDGSEGNAGYSILQMNSSGQLHVYATDPGTWYLLMTGATADTPAFMSAEGDLFIGGNHSTIPQSWIHIKRSDFNLSTGAHSDITRDLTGWQNPLGSVSSKYFIPTSDTQQLWWASVDDGGVGGGGSTAVLDVTTMNYASGGAIATDELIWVIEWSGDANSGSWSNAGDVSEARHIQFASSWLYKNLAESDLYVFTTPDYVGTSLDNTTSTHFEDAIDRALKVHACINAVTTSTGDYLTNRSGSRLYARMSDEKEWYMLAEVDYDRIYCMG